jgi:hypothetical protein
VLEANLNANNPSAKATLREVSFQDLPWISSRVPHLKGRLSGELEYTNAQATLNLSSPSLVVNGESAQNNLPLDLSPADTALQAKNGDKFESLRQGLPMQAKGVWKNGVLSTDLKLGDSQIAVALGQNALSGRVQAAEFPLHWLVAAWFGSVNGAAFWTGSSNFRYDFKNRWASSGTVVGQRVRFEGGGDQLVGRTVLRFEDEQLYIDQLQLDGKGSWRGRGSWGRKGSNLSLNLENTTFTPVLNLIPNLRVYKPEGSGTLRLALSGDTFKLEAEDFAFKLGSVKAQTPRIRLEVGQTVRADGQIEVTAPYSAKAELSGEGNLGTFTVKAKGLANVPLLSERAPLEVSLGYPGYLLNIGITDPDSPQTQAQFSGILFPLRGALIGRVPIRYKQYYLQEGEAEANLNVAERGGKYLIWGDVEVLRAKLALPEGQKEVVVQTPSSTPNQGSPVEFSNLRIRAERNVTIQEALIKGEVGGEVFLNGPMNNPELNGQVRPLRGEFTLLQRNFILRDSVQNYARLTPARGIFPEISAIADTAVSTTDTQNNRLDLRIELVLTGEFVRENGKAKAKLNPSFRAFKVADSKEFEIPDSNGNLRKLNQEEIYALLTLGDYRLTNLGAERITQSALSAAFQSFLLGGIERELARTLGLDQFRLEASFLDGGDISKTRFTIGKYIIPELLLVGQADFRGYLTFYGEYRNDPFRVRVTGKLSPSGSTNLEWSSANLAFGWGINSSIDLTTEWGFEGEEVNIRFGIQYRF